MKIARALIHYDGDMGEYPPNLIVLVSKGYLKQEDLIYTKPDKSTSIPDYYTGRSVSTKLGLPLLKAPSEDGTYQVIIDTFLGTKGVKSSKTISPDKPIKN